MSKHFRWQVAPRPPRIADLRRFFDDDDVDYLLHSRRQKVKFIVDVDPLDLL